MTAVSAPAGDWRAALLHAVVMTAAARQAYEARMDCRRDILGG